MADNITDFINLASNLTQLNLANKEDSDWQTVAEQLLRASYKLPSQFSSVGLWLVDPISKQLQLAGAAQLKKNTPEFFLKKIKLTNDEQPLIVAITNKTAIIEKDQSGTNWWWPIENKGKLLGGIVYRTAKKRNKFKDDERQSIQVLNLLVAISMENSNLFEKLTTEKDSLQQANEQLRAMDKMKDEFLAIMSHELRTPLTTIKNYLWLAERKSDEAEQYLVIAKKATDRTIHTVNDMLITTRIEHDRFKIQQERVDLVKLTQEIVKEFKPSINPRRIKLSWQSKYPEIWVEADRFKLGEVWQNIVGNAVKFTQVGEIRIRLDKEKGWAKFSVTDTGPGITKEQQENLFKKFSLGERSYVKVNNSGCGLGLYIAQQIVNLHDGQIKVKSTLDRGSTFTVYLPLENNKNEK